MTSQHRSQDEECVAALHDMQNALTIEQLSEAWECYVTLQRDAALSAP